MSAFKPPHANDHQLSFPDAYNIVWGAANIAMTEPTISNNVKDCVGAEIADLFSRLDTIREQTAIFQNATDATTEPFLTLGTLLQGVTDKITTLYKENSVGHNTPINPFLIKDDRLTALYGLDLYVRIAKNKLIDQRQSS